MLVVGGICYGIFLIFSGATVLQGFIILILFGELIIVWNAMSYLTAVKDYKGILLSFGAAVLLTFALGFVLLLLHISAVEALLIAVSAGYGLMMIWDVILLYRYFPQSDQNNFLFLRWVDEFFPLAITGLLLNIGLFAHLVIMWFGRLGYR